MLSVGFAIPRQLEAARVAEAARLAAVERTAEADAKESVKEMLRTAEIELCLGKQLGAKLLSSQDELAHRVTKMRRKFALQYGFVVPEIKVTNSLDVAPKSYQIKIHGTAVALQDLRLGEFLVITGDGPKPDVPGLEVREPGLRHEGAVDLGKLSRAR